ncbi:hypothetical protein TRFO_03095 [Tritrichomonas foetus]|uniref:Uncharacterized protein n=1 Tax=Tritrichomonas foetus TaxID=1144522 RepID=A0A1J4KWL3_9EUKA|nr:hypothetical protein TRFO_03095 [Tritrichomonas foetus]|eukprot:OHT14094.1 hypothetical protein TRFO_03095 [Tritrichomonas foetus]
MNQLNDTYMNPLTLFFFLQISRSIAIREKCHTGNILNHCNSISQTFEGENLSYQSNVFTISAGVVASFYNCRFSNYKLINIESGLIVYKGKNLRLNFTLCSFRENSVTSINAPMIYADSLESANPAHRGYINFSLCKFRGNLVGQRGILNLYLSNINIETTDFQDNGNTTITDIIPEYILDIKSQNTFSNCRISKCMFRNNYESLTKSVINLQVRRSTVIDQCSFINCGSEKTHSISLPESPESFPFSFFIKDCCFIDKFPEKVHIDTKSTVYLQGKLVFSTSQNFTLNFFKTQKNIISSESELLFDPKICLSSKSKGITEEINHEKIEGQNNNESASAVNNEEARFNIDESPNSPDLDTFKQIRVVIILICSIMLLVIVVVIIFTILNGTLTNTFDDSNQFVTIEDVFTKQHIDSPTVIMDNESDDCL